MKSLISRLKKVVDNPRDNFFDNSQKCDNLSVTRIDIKNGCQQGCHRSCQQRKWLYINESYPSVTTVTTFSIKVKKVDLGTRISICGSLNKGFKRIAKILSQLSHPAFSGGGRYA